MLQSDRKPWSPSNRHASWRDYKDVEPQTSFHSGNSGDSYVKRQLDMGDEGSSQRSTSRSRTPSRDEIRANYPGGEPPEIPASVWRLSFRGALSHRSQQITSMQRLKSVGQLPVFAGLDIFTLRSLGITSLRGIGRHPEVRKIFLQSNYLTSFEGWEHEPQLTELHVEDNLIESFRGIRRSTTIESLWLRGNPIAQTYHYRTMAIAAFGPTLRLIDGDAVRRVELQRAKQLGKVVADAIREGWILDTMRDPEADYDVSLEQYMHYRKRGPSALQARSERSSHESVFDEKAEDSSQRRSHATSPSSSERVPSSLTKLKPRAARSVPRSSRSSRRPPSVSSRRARTWMSESSSGSEPEMRTRMRLRSNTSSAQRDPGGSTSAAARERSTPAGVATARNSRVRNLQYHSETRMRGRATSSGGENEAEKGEAQEEGGGGGVGGQVEATKQQILVLMQQLAREGSELKWQLDNLQERGDQASLARPRSRAWESGPSPLDIPRAPARSLDPSPFAGAFDPDAAGRAPERDHKLERANPATEWTQIREMTNSLNSDIQSLDRRMNQRRHAADLQDWIERRNRSPGNSDRDESLSDDGMRRNSSSRPARAVSTDDDRGAFAHEDRGADGALSLAGGRAVTKRSLKRLALERWSKVLDAAASRQRAGDRHRRERQPAPRPGRVSMERHENDYRGHTDDGDREHEQIRISAADLAAAALRATHAEAELARMRRHQDSLDAPRGREGGHQPRARPPRRDEEAADNRHPPAADGAVSWESRAASEANSDLPELSEDGDHTAAHTERDEPSPARFPPPPKAEPPALLAPTPPQHESAYAPTPAGLSAAALRAQAAEAERVEMERMATDWRLQPSPSPERPLHADRSAVMPDSAFPPEREGPMVSAAAHEVEEEGTDEEEAELRRRLEEMQARKSKATGPSHVPPPHIAPEEPARDHFRAAPQAMEPEAVVQAADEEGERFVVRLDPDEWNDYAENDVDTTHQAISIDDDGQDERSVLAPVSNGAGDAAEHDQSAMPLGSDQPMTSAEESAASFLDRHALTEPVMDGVEDSFPNSTPTAAGLPLPLPLPSAAEATQDSTWGDTTVGDSVLGPISHTDSSTKNDSPAPPQPPAPKAAAPRQEAGVSAQDLLDAYSMPQDEPAPVEMGRRESQGSARTDTRSEATAGERGEESGAGGKKKKKKAEKGVSGKTIMLTNCEIKGDAVEGSKVTAFAKRIKKLEISCTFQWFRIFPNGAEVAIPGADKASYMIATQDVGFPLKVIGIPVSKKNGEEGEPVTAVSGAVMTNPNAAPPPVAATQNHQEPHYPQQPPSEDPAAAPCLADWKVEMNAQQEYVDPIRMQYVYQGGQEGNTEIEWYRETLSESIRGGDFERVPVKEPMSFVPTVDDVDRRLKILLTPVRSDGLRGPTYQHVLEPLKLPAQTAEEVRKCLAEFKSNGANFLVAEVDLANPAKPTGHKRIVCDDKQLKVRNAQTNKTESKVKITPGFIQVVAHREINRIFELHFIPLSRQQPAGRPLTLVADSVHSRDIIVLVLRGLSQHG